MATAIPDTCALVNQALLTETGRIGGTMFDRIALKRPIIRLISENRGAWQHGRGSSYSVATFERAFAPLTGDPWTTIAASDGADVNSCLPPTDQVAFGQTTRTVTPIHYALNTEHFCIKDILFGWQYAEWLAKVSRALEPITEWVWARRYTQDYFTQSGHHLTLSIANGTQDHASAYNTSNLPTSTLSQGVLESIYGVQWREGGAGMNMMDEGTGQRVATVILSPEASDRILRSNPEFRQDVRWAYATKGDQSPLIPGFPTKRRNYGGWVHEIDPYPRRFIFSGGAYVEVAPWIASATTKGNKWEQNPAYQTAPFEEAIVFHPDTFKSLAVNTIGNPSPGWNFSARTWMGEFSWRNILHETCNPDGTIGFFRALFASAAEPGHPELGWTILFQRCGTDLNLHSCYTS